MCLQYYQISTNYVAREVCQITTRILLGVSSNWQYNVNQGPQNKNKEYLFKPQPLISVLEL